MQVAEAANDASFQVAISAISEWALNNGFDNLQCMAFSEQESFLKQLLRQYILYRSVKFLFCVCSLGTMHDTKDSHAMMTCLIPVYYGTNALLKTTLLCADCCCEPHLGTSLHCFDFE